MASVLLMYKRGITNLVAHTGRVLWSLGRASSSRSLDEQVTVTDDGSIIVCWHPETHFPYDCSRALPVEQETHSNLKIQSLDEVDSVFNEKKEEFVRQELMSLTYTTKHRWFPRARDKYAKKTPPDREYL
ncbi:28S ribosomal protein L42, mitochondrial [Zootermopsis nevadensis]|uniref:Large ribosomal subunit protein mL42 n=1 Tax=Zootermopsis nevadensis TaxID=136037 RepID=A0A067QZS5_ZOONE|nr:28S ribosomal protein L42, mitochondrial [Zootermopsis nevadensis]